MNIPSEIQLNKSKDTLTLHYSHAQYSLSAEFLRVHSPSAEVRGHGIGQAVLQTGKRWVGIADLEMAGNYALKITFSDGHDSGLYDWDYLYQLCVQQHDLWQNYLGRLAAAGGSRETESA